MPGEVCLIVETGLRGDGGRRDAVEQQPSGVIDSSARDVAVRWKAEGQAEGAGEVAGMSTQQSAGLGEV